MKAMIPCLLIIGTMLFHPARAEMTDLEWQGKVAEKYPAAAISGSHFNNVYVRSYKERVLSDPGFMATPDWPMRLADEVASTLTPAELANATAKPAPPKREERSWLGSLLQWMSDTHFPLSQCVFGAGIAGIVLWTIRNHRRAKQLKAQADEYVRQAWRDKSLPAVATDMRLKSDETAFYSEEVRLYETRAVRYTQRQGSRVRNKWSVGSRASRSYSRKELTLVDEGTLTITDKRFIFGGQDSNRMFDLENIVTIESDAAGVEISSETREKKMTFGADNPFLLAAILRICCDQTDPLHLSEEDEESEDSGES